MSMKYWLPFERK